MKSGGPAGLCASCLLAAAMPFSSTVENESPRAQGAESSDPGEQDRFGPYRICRLLGEGGMGAVYLAEQTEPIRRRVALKVVKLGMDTDQVLARFNHERHVLGRMEHTNIARILDAGASSRGRPFFVMDYIDGEPITLYCDRHQLSIDERLALFLPVCRAVQHAHQKGIIHRDIKPSNVLVAIEDGKPVPKVIDFGIARAIDATDDRNTQVTQFGQMVGTPEYASPEQANVITGEIGAASDIYSLGVLLYEMLIGAVPFDGALLRRAGYAEMLRILREEEAPSLVQRLDALGKDGTERAARRGTDAAGLRKLLAGDLNSIVKRALDKSPAGRYASASDLAADIERRLRGEPVSATFRRQMGPARRRLAVTAAALLLVPAALLIKAPLHSSKAQLASVVVLCDLSNDTGERSFDDTFRESISSELQPSGKIKVLPNGRVEETLTQMRKAPGSRVTPEAAREVCQRTSSAAVMQPFVTAAGSGYLVSLRIESCTDETLLGEEQSRVADRHAVIPELRRLSIRLESKEAARLAELQAKAASLYPATTFSLDALKSFSAARQRAYVSPADSLVLFKRATELDPEFAMAHAWLGRSYADAGEQALAMASIRQAHRLRERVSDKENLFITYNYDREVLRNLELARQVCESWIERYPEDMMPHAFLSGFTSKGVARYDNAIQEAEKALGLDPDFTVGYVNIAEAYLFLNRPDEVTATMQRAARRNLASKDHLETAFFAAFLKRDRAAMDQTGKQMATDSPNGEFEHCASLVSGFEGRFQEARERSIQAVNLARQAHLMERAALFEGAAAVREAVYGHDGESSTRSLAAQRLASGRDADFPAAFALAFTRNSAAASRIAAGLEKRYPEDTCVRFTYLPTIRALIALNEGHAATALEVLNVSKTYELAQTGVSEYVHYGALYSTFVRGLTYEKLRRPREAAEEFQRMLDHPGLLQADPIAPAVRLHLGRALRDAGERARAKATYEQFLDEWKGADPGVPLLIQAKAEFARL